MGFKQKGERLKDIVFRLGDNFFGFDILFVEEVLPANRADVSYIPHINKYFVGVVRSSSNGQVPLVNLSLLFSESDAFDFNPSGCIVVFKFQDSGLEDHVIGVYMDSAVNVITIRGSEEGVNTKNITHIFPFVSNVFKISQKDEIVDVRQVDVEKLMHSLEIIDGME